MVNLPGVNTTQFLWTRNKMPQQPRPTGTIYQPELAAEAIVLAIEKERRQVFLGFPTLEAVLGEKFIPGLLDKYLAHAAWEGALLNKPVDPNQPDNFWQPLPGDHGAHGPFDALSKTSSLELWAVERRNGLLGVTLAGVAAAGMALLGRAARERSRPARPLRRAAAAIRSALLAH